MCTGRATCTGAQCSRHGDHTNQSSRKLDRLLKSKACELKAINEMRHQFLIYNLLTHLCARSCYRAACDTLFLPHFQHCERASVTHIFQSCGIERKSGLEGNMPTLSTGINALASPQSMADSATNALDLLFVVPYRCRNILRVKVCMRCARLHSRE
jgi:hypothetical protein